MGAYHDPDRPPQLGLIGALMRMPTTGRQSPAENQLTEALAWVLNRDRELAREFALLLVRGDAEAEGAVRSAARIGARTRLTLRSPSGGALWPDLSLCGSGRSFQLLVEVKVLAEFGEFPAPGSPVSQPDYYAQALAAEADGAGVRRVGTLSQDPASAKGLGRHPLRARDIGWQELRALLDGGTGATDVAEVARDLVQAIDLRADPRPPRFDDPQVRELLDWATELLGRALPALARACGGVVTTNPRRGNEVPYVGGYLRLTVPGGPVLEPWLWVAPAGSSYSVMGEPDALWLAPRPVDAAAVDDAALERAFRRETDLANFPDWRASLPVEEVSTGDLARDCEVALTWAIGCLDAAGLIHAGP